MIVEGDRQIMVANRRFYLRKLSVHPIDPDTGCINFLRYTNKDGYGSLKIGGKGILAHRFFYEKYKGPIPEGLLVLHRCNNPSCINPEHLYIGTHKQNTRDMDDSGRRASPVLNSLTEEQHRILTNASYTITMKASLTGLNRTTTREFAELLLSRKKAASTKSPTPLELLIIEARKKRNAESNIRE